MTIFTVCNKPGGGQETKLVGVHLPQLVSNHLALYTLANGVTKSSVVRNVMEDWSVTERLGPAPMPEMDLVHVIIKKIWAEWKIYKSRHPANDLYNFKKILRSEFRRKGVSKEYINKILSKIK